MKAQRFDGVLFDLLTALLDSWTLWGEAAGDAAAGRRWREAYLRHVYATGVYRPYEDLVAEATAMAGLPATAAATLIGRWDELAPWPEAASTLRRLRAAGARLGVVTNCSEALGWRAADRLGVPFDVVVTAERAGAYKPDQRPYRLAVAELGAPPGRTLFVAGSPGDVLGAGEAGMPVYWHNRIGAPPASPDARPLRTSPSLEGLLDVYETGSETAQ